VEGFVNTLKKEEEEKIEKVPFSRKQKNLIAREILILDR